MSQEELQVYYNYLYPFESLVQWLTQNGRRQLAHRQLSFQYEGVGVERYVTFVDAAAMKSRMISRFAKIPLKVDAGAIWNKIPQKDGGGFTIERELIFDFDMNDYDDVRTCCDGKKVCVRCWRFLIVAVQILEQALLEDFGFNKLMFVFSGGRGLHIWVCDKRARELKDSVRKAIVDYLQLVTGNEKAASMLSERVIFTYEQSNYWRTKDIDITSRDKVKAYMINQYFSSHVERSLQILDQYFIDIFDDQEVFSQKNPKCIEIMLRIIGNRNQKLKDNVQYRWRRANSRRAKDMFQEMTDQVVRYETAITVNDYVVGRYQEGGKIQRLTFIQEEIMLSFLYPRMDYNVSTMQNHLLKLPFSIHPSSKRVSIPLFKRQLLTFDPHQCVKIGDLLRQLQNFQRDGILQGRTNQELAKNTILREPIQALQEFSLTLE